jgi:hypothetical protein
VERVVAQAVGGDAHLCLWSQAGGGDAYLGYLQLGDSFIVTSDSISMTTEALMTGKPVEIYRLPQRLNFVQQAVSWLSRSRRWPISALYDIGFLEQKLGRDRFHRNFITSRVLPSHHSEFDVEAERARTRVLGLVSETHLLSRQ